MVNAELSFDETDVSELPHGAVIASVWVIDSFFSMLHFFNWREYVPFGFEKGSKSWMSIKVHTFREGLAMGHMLTYSEYLAERGVAAQDGVSWNMRYMYDFMFRTPSTVLGDLLTWEAMVVLVAIALIFRILKSVLLPFFSNLGRLAARRSHGLDWEFQPENQIRIVKFGEYTFRLLYHFAVSAVGLCYFWGTVWWSPSQGFTQNYYAGYPHPVEPGMAWYYLVQCAYNLDALVSLVELSCTVRFVNPLQHGKLQSPIQFAYSKTKRGDFIEMLIHHLVTNMLIFTSSTLGFTRVGSAVFLLHDLSDVPVDLSKLANFLKWKLATTCGWLLMVITWFVTRLIILPLVILRSVFVNASILLEEKVVDPTLYKLWCFIFYMLLFFIISLHVVWFSMMVQMGAIWWSTGHAHDLSEHKTGELDIVDDETQMKLNKTGTLLNNAEKKGL